MVLQSRLEAAEAAHTKILKDAPSQDHERKAITEAKSSFELAVQARQDREERGAAKAAERRAQRTEHIGQLKEQVLLLEVGLNELEDSSARVHAERVVAAAAADTQVLGLFDRKLQGLQAPAPTFVPMETAAAAAGEPPSELEAARARILDLQQKLAAAAGAAKVAAEDATRMREEFERTFEDIEASQLPLVEVPGKEAVAAFGVLFQTLQSWVSTGANFPFSWEALRQLYPEGPAPESMFKGLLGQLWSRWHVQDSSPPTGVIPRQLALLAYHCLTNMKLEYDSQDARSDVMKRAEEGYAKVRESSKRARVSQPFPAGVAPA